MKAWDTLYPWVLPYVLGCPNPTVDRALCDAMREFCTAAPVWVEWSDDVPASGTTQRFDFDVPTGAELVKARRCVVDGQDYGVRSIADLPLDWQDEDATDPDECLVQIDNTEFLLVPKPSAGHVIRVEVVLKPTIAATTFPDELLNRYGEAIAAGAKCRLLMVPGQAWTNPKLAEMCSSQFATAKHSAANQSFRQRNAAERRVKKWG